MKIQTIFFALKVNMSVKKKGKNTVVELVHPENACFYILK